MWKMWKTLLGAVRVNGGFSVFGGKGIWGFFLEKKSR